MVAALSNVSARQLGCGVIKEGFQYLQGLEREAERIVRLTHASKST